MRFHTACRIGILAAVCGLGRAAESAAGTAGAGQAEHLVRIRVRSHAEANRLYPGNRPPLLPRPLVRLPLGAVRPAGWLRGQLERMADGFTGRLEEISPWCRFAGNAWAAPDGKGEHGWEELPYWLRGFTDLGFLLGDQRIIAHARRWIEAVLAGARPDGWFGPESNRRGPDLWPNMVMMYALRSWYEATGDPQVLEVMRKYFYWQQRLPFDRLLPGSWQKWRAGDNLDSLYWLYNHTGDARLLEIARINHERTADWSGGIPSWHGVNLCECFREPAWFYQQYPDPRYLAATERIYDQVMGEYGQVPGGMFGADENCRRGFTGPRQAAETCSMVEFMHSFEMLVRSTGEAKWADRCEDVAFNSLPCAMTPDLKGLHYLTAPNQIQLDRRNKAPGIQNRGDMFSYNPFQYRCCQHNVAMGWPYFCESLWAAAPGGGLAAVLYAPCTVTAKVAAGTRVQWTEDTAYPFDTAVTLRLRSPQPLAFPLYLRIPHWCRAAAVEVNGQRLLAGAGPGWIRVRRTWHSGDRVRLELPVRISLRFWKRNHNAVSVDRGPLAYSLEIGEKWRRYGGTDAFPAFEVFPATPWNYGLVLDPAHPTADFRVETSSRPLASQPFTPAAAPIRIRTHGKRIPEWRADSGGLVGPLADSPVRSREKTEEIVLIPMGCARLRISAFPWIGPHGRPWGVRRVQVLVSHCWAGDAPGAVVDGIVPRSSGDTRIPRFTWWDHRGTREWLELHFGRARRLSEIGVYWFDDTGTGGCRTPKQWRLLELEPGGKWMPVNTPGPFGTERDRFNSVRFAPVETAALRLEVQLRPGYSGGILEIRIGPGGGKGP